MPGRRRAMPGGRVLCLRAMRPPAPSLPFVFFLSGAAALAFEALWFRQARLAFGSSVWASSLVLAAFMAGLGLGNGLAARFGDRLRSPLRSFALLEVLIAVSGVALVEGLPRLAPGLASGLRAVSDQPALGNALRLGVAFALLVLPSTAMGLTLPLLVRALTASDLGFGVALGRLYGWNTLGGVVGAIGVETLAIGNLGVRGTAIAAAALDGVAAAAALALARRAAGAASSVRRTPSAAPIRGGPPWRLAVFLAGFALLALEVCWFRFLSLYVVTHTEAFACMLGVVLAGIAVGGLAAARALSWRADAPRIAAPLALLASALCGLGYAAFPTATLWLGEARPARVGEILALAAPLMLPVSMASGAFFVLAGAGLRAARSRDAATAGALTLANTAGAALGALGAGFVLLPTLGIERSLFALGALYAAIGALLARRQQSPRGVLAACAALAATGLVLFPFGDMRDRHLRRPLAGYERVTQDAITVREGLNETLLLLETRFLGEPYYQRLLTNSFSMSANDVQSRRYMELFVHLPVAVHPRVERALLISYGIGTTARALVATPDIAHIDVVDISRDILELSDRVFVSPAVHPLRDPRVRVHVEDGRHFLQLASDRYDLITGEPPPPMLAGVVNLYTREYFALLRERLSPGGIATYWLPIFQLSDRAALSIVRAFCDVFEDCSLWRGMGFNLMLMGTRDARGPVPAQRFRRPWRTPELRRELETLGLELPEQLGAHFLVGAEDLRARVRDVPALVDDWPKRIRAPSRSIEAQSALYADWLTPQRARERFVRDELIRRLWPPELVAAALPYFELQRLLDSFSEGIRSDRWSERLGDLRAVLAGSGLRAPVLWLLGSDGDAQRIVARAPQALRREPRAQLHIAIGHLAERRPLEALEALARAERAPETQEWALALRLFTLCTLDRCDEARRLAAERGPALGDHPRVRDYWEWMRYAFGL